MDNIWGKILVSDDEGVSFHSPKPIYVTAKEDVVMESPALHGQAVNGELLTAVCDVEAGTVHASVTQSNVYDLSSAATNAEGSNCVAYAPYDDAPEEEKFDVWGLVGNIIAGVVAVAVVAVIAFAAVSLLGPFFLATAAMVHTTAVAAAVGAGIGGGMAVGFQALSDIKNRTVSSTRTYVYKGIGGGASGAVTGAVGPGIFDPMKKLAYIAKATFAGAVGGFLGGGIELALNSFMGQEYDYDPSDVIISAIDGGLGGLLGGCISAWIGTTTAQKAMSDLFKSSRSYIKNYLRALLSKKGITSTNEMIRYLNQIYGVSYGSINAFKSIIQSDPAPFLLALRLVSLTITNAGRESLGSFLVQFLQFIAPEETENLLPSTSDSEGYLPSAD